MRGAQLIFRFGMALAICFSPSLIHPWGNLRAGGARHAAILSGGSVPADVRQVLESKCGDCHTDNTRWPLYSKVARVSWLVEHDVHDGREALNLSRWEQYSAEMQVGLLSRIASEARSGQMPLKQYVWIHPEMQLSGSEQQQLYEWARTERKRLKQRGGQVQ